MTKKSLEEMIESLLDDFDHELLWKNPNDRLYEKIKKGYIQRGKSLFTQLVKESVGEDEKVPSQKKIEGLALTLTNLELAQKAVEFHARNKLRSIIREAFRKRGVKI